MRAVLTALVALLAAAPLAPATPPAAPDLHGEVWPEDVTPGAAVRVLGLVRNDGSADAEAFDVELRINGTLFETQRILALARGEAAWVESASTFVGEGEVQTFEMRLDAAGEVAESNESNNVATTVVLFSHDRPDLALDVRDARATGWPRPRVTVEYRACNLGNRTAGGDIIVSGVFHGHGIPHVTPGALDLPVRTHAALAPGACVFGTAAVDAPHDLVGYRTVVLRVDARGGDPVREWGLDNNRDSANVWMGPGPDPRTLDYL